MYVYYSLCDACTLFVCCVGPSTLSLRIVLIAFDSKVCSYMLGTPTLGGVCIKLIIGLISYFFHTLAIISPIPSLNHSPL